MKINISKYLLKQVKKCFSDIELIRYVEPILFWGIDYIQEVQNIKKNNDFEKLMLALKELIILRAGLKLDVPPIDFTLTNRCTLKCKECGAMMPFYSKENYWTISFEQFKKDLDKLLLCVGNCYHLKFIGGEPLLVKDIAKMLEYACSKKQVKLINITSNGTIVPNTDLLKAMSKYRKKIAYTISDYSSNKEIKILKHEEITNKLNEYGIKYFLSNHPWTERGEIYKRNRSYEEIKNTYLNCWQMVCTALFNGEIHPCTRSAAIKILTEYNFEKHAYIDIRNNKTQTIKKDLHKFFKKDCFSVCDFCQEKRPEVIPTAIQINEQPIIGMHKTRSR